MFLLYDRVTRFAGLSSCVGLRRRHMGNDPFPHSHMERAFLHGRAGICGAHPSWCHLLQGGNDHTWKELPSPAGVIRPISSLLQLLPCLSQLLNSCSLSSSVLSVFLLHPGLMMELFGNDNCLGCAQEDHSPFYRIDTAF